MKISIKFKFFWIFYGRVNGERSRTKFEILCANQIAGDCTSKTWKNSNTFWSRILYIPLQHFLFYLSFPFLFFKNLFLHFKFIQYNSTTRGKQPRRVYLFILENNEPYQSRCRIYRDLLQHRRTRLVWMRWQDELLQRLKKIG